MSYHDDNFGHWHSMDDPGMQDFYRTVQEKSVEKECVDCGRKVKIMPDYECCDSCATRREHGLEY